MTILYLVKDKFHHNCQPRDIVPNRLFKCYNISNTLFVYRIQDILLTVLCAYLESF